MGSSNFENYDPIREILHRENETTHLKFTIIMAFFNFSALFNLVY